MFVSCGDVAQGVNLWWGSLAPRSCIGQSHGKCPVGAYSNRVTFSIGRGEGILVRFSSKNAAHVRYRASTFVWGFSFCPQKDGSAVTTKFATWSSIQSDDIGVASDDAAGGLNKLKLAT